MTRFDFPKSVRLLKSVDFDRVFNTRCSCADGLMVGYFALREFESENHGRPRIGLVVSRKIGNAVVRNRWKRALREAFRLAQHDLPCQMDMVILPRKGALPDVVRLQNSLKQLARLATKKLAKHQEREH